MIQIDYIDYIEIFSYSTEPYVQNELFVEYMKSYYPMRHMMTPHEALGYLFKDVLQKIEASQMKFRMERHSFYSTARIEYIPNYERLKFNMEHLSFCRIL